MIYKPYLYGAITRYGSSFQTILILMFATNLQVLQPLCCRNNIGLGYSDFARHYSRNHSCFLLLRLLRCFSSAGSPILRCTAPSMQWVAPFGHLRIYSYVQSPQLFAAYHVLLRL